MEKSLKNIRTFDLKWFGWNNGFNDSPKVKSDLGGKCNGKPSILNEQQCYEKNGKNPMAKTTAER